MGQPGGSLVTSLYRRCGAERSRSPERIERRSIEHIFGGGRMIAHGSRSGILLGMHHTFLEEHKVVDH